jgi:CelD/BcsL family acetyltransferase involved in cellulose biosynthesis
MVLKQLHPIEKRETALKTVDPIVNPGWDAFICAHPEGTIFHHSSWARVLAETYGDSYEYYILEDENGHITGALPLWHFNNALSGNRLVCLPHSDHCYPLVSDEKDYEALLAGPLQNIESNRASSLEIRGWSSLGQPENCRLQSGHFHLVHIADLDKNPDEIIGDMTRNGRYNLRYAAKNPLAVRLGQDERDLRTLHRFHAQASARHGKTPVALSFLRSIYRNVISAGYGYLFIAELAGSIAAVNLYICFNGTAFCMFSAQDTERAEYRANYYLHWKAMEYFHNRGYHS